MCSVHIGYIFERLNFELGNQQRESIRCKYLVQRAGYRRACRHSFVAATDDQRMAASALINVDIKYDSWRTALPRYHACNLLPQFKKYCGDGVVWG